MWKFLKSPNIQIRLLEQIIQCKKKYVEQLECVCAFTWTVTGQFSQPFVKIVCSLISVE